MTEHCFYIFTFVTDAAAVFFSTRLCFISSSIWLLFLSEVELIDWGTNDGIIQYDIFALLLYTRAELCAVINKVGGGSLNSAALFWAPARFWDFSLNNMKFFAANWGLETD